MDDWNPIKTAPKDGRWLWMFGNSKCGVVWCIANWRGNNWCMPDGEVIEPLQWKPLPDGYDPYIARKHEETMDRTDELLDRIAALEARVAQLEARPQPATTIGGAGGWAFPWGTLNPAKVELSQTTGAIGTNVSRETSKGPVGSAENPLIVKDR
jgi:hypothetical protein